MSIMIEIKSEFPWKNMEEMTPISDIVKGCMTIYKQCGKMPTGLYLGCEDAKLLQNHLTKIFEGKEILLEQYLCDLLSFSNINYLDDLSAKGHVLLYHTESDVSCVINVR